MKKFFGLLKYLIPYKWHVVVNVLSNVLAAIFSLFSLAMLIPFLQLLFGTVPLVEVEPEFTLSAKGMSNYLNYFLSSLIKNHDQATALLFVIVLVVIASFLKNMFTYLSLFYLAPIRTGVLKDMRNKLYRKVVELPLGFFTEEKKGDIISKMTNDVNEIEVSIIRSLEMFFRDPIIIIIHLIGLIYISPQLTLFVLIILPLTGGVIGRVGKNLRKTSFKGQTKMGIILTIIEETIGGLRVIKAFNAEKKVIARFESMNSLYTLLMKKMWRRRDLASPLSEFLGTIVVVLVLWYGGNLIFDGKGNLGPEALIAYIGIFYMIINPAKSFSNAYYNVLKGMASADRIDSILVAENPIKVKPGAKKIESFNNEIEYRNVSFRYENDWVLKNINLTIKKGMTVALVGQSGSGKSTMVDLLPRFWDVTEGEILIDGVNIKDLDMVSLRNLMGNVNQEPILFNDNFFNNIAFGVENAKMEDVIAAAKIANAHDFIMATPNGYHTNVGDRGSKLSGGQRQRVSIARAILKNPPIMILDEATSALDTESERLVQDAIDNLMKHRTSLVIAHRLSTIRKADLICVLHEGEIVERGKHEELLAINGYYSKLHSMQLH
ncbi:ABC transporter ATP-binding protein [Tenuifilum thalassicum]|uniref:ABC transporter ATP-binding protein n=1 Tax=Tenuifilum thalassicum TaxID=2590900 RepID=A0A7D3XL68_9BACT|nr:ABC transporter ATP-binding protein [Tenuifilum thalassicum]QKG80155.1 ABC transporter ATP-binding protein [Tenuifilum thalassicum]